MYSRHGNQWVQIWGPPERKMVPGDLYQEPVAGRTMNSKHNHGRECENE